MLDVIRFVTGYIPQGISFILAIYAFCKVKIDARRFLLSSVLMITTIWLVRQLPITMGVNMLPNMLALIALCYGINRLPLMQTVIGCLSVTVFMLLVELANILVFSWIYGIRNFERLNANESFTTLSAIPPMALFTAAVVIFYFVQTRKRKN